LFWFFQNEPLGVKGAIVTKAQICKVHVSLEPIGSDYQEPNGYSFIFVDIVNPLGRITLINLVTRNPEGTETMNDSTIHALIDEARAQQQATTKRENLVCSVITCTLCAFALFTIASWAFVL
jgi:hypothetical protein